MEKKVIIILCAVLTGVFCACSSDSVEKDSAVVADETTSESAISSNETKAQGSIDEFFVSIGTDISKSDIEDVAKSMGLYIDSKRSGTGIYTYRVAINKDIANVNKLEKGSYVTVSFDTLNNDAITAINYFDAERMVAGYWSPDTGYLLADYNYPQIVYYDENTDKVYSRSPVSDAREIIGYSFNGELGENLLETLFASVTFETTKDDLLLFVNEHGLSYNSRGAGNEEVIAYCYEIGDKSGENGSYITFSTDSNNLVTRVTYRYYPANYRNGYSANFYSESYAANFSVPSGFVLEAKDNLTEYPSAEELLAQLHK